MTHLFFPSLFLCEDYCKLGNISYMYQLLLAIWVIGYISYVSWITMDKKVEMNEKMEYLETFGKVIRSCKICAQTSYTREVQ